MAAAFAAYSEASDVLWRLRGQFTHWRRRWRGRRRGRRRAWHGTTVTQRAAGLRAAGRGVRVGLTGAAVGPAAAPV
jgi:hypothetical protein